MKPEEIIARYRKELASKGGKARASKLSAARRIEIAKRASAAAKAKRDATKPTDPPSGT